MNAMKCRGVCAWSPILAGLLAGSTLGQPLDGTVIADRADARYETDSQAQLTGSTATAELTSYVGSGYYAGTNLSHYVAPFKLPDLGEGSFTEVRFHIQANDETTTWRIPVNLWAIPGARVSKNTLGSDVRTADETHNQRGDLVMEEFLGRNTFGDTYHATPAGGIESARLCDWLNDAYGDGGNAGRFAFLRLSPRALTPAENGPSSIDSAFGILTADFVFANAAFQPYLSYTFTPATAGSPVIDRFTISRDRVAEGGSVTLDWSVNNADAVYLDDGFGEFEVGATETYTFDPWFTTTLRLRAVNANGERVAVRAVEVLPLQGELTAELRDARTTTDPANGVVTGTRSEADLTDAQVLVGRAADSSQVSHLVIPFRLPDAGPGRFENVSLQVWSMGASGDPAGSAADLFAIPDARESAVVLNSDVCDGRESPLTRGIPVQQGFLNADHAEADTQASTAEGAPREVLSAWLSDAYANGANAGKFVFLRLSPDTLAGISGNGIAVATSDAASPMTRPWLSYSFVPDAAMPPTIRSFACETPVIAPGWATTISWNVEDAASVSLSPGIGTVATQGSTTLRPLQPTTYTLTATNAAGSRTRTLAIATGPMRFFRLVPTAARSSGRVNLAEFQLLDANGNRIGGASTSFVGNLNSASAANGNDNNTSTYWDEALDHPLTLDFGTAKPTVRRYRIATGDNANRDPLSWRVEGSPDRAVWVVLDQRSAFPTQNQRRVFLDAIDLPYSGDGSGSASAPFVRTFTSDRSDPAPGESVALQWNVAGADDVTILPNIGSVGSSGSVSVTAVGSTTYTLTASNAAGSTTSSFTINAVERYRYFRFVPTSVRDGVNAAAVAISEFQILSNGARLTGATSSNPGGYDFEGFGPPAQANDNNLTTYWVDGNKGALVLDFVTGRSANTYRIGLTDSSLSWADPTGWRVEASNNGTSWTILDEQTNVNVPQAEASRNQFLTAGTLAPSSVTPPPTVGFGAASSTVNQGQGTTLQWTVTGAASVTIDHGIGSVPASGSVAVSPNATTTYTLTAIGDGGTTVTTARVSVIPAPIISFTATAAPGGQPGSTTLAWNVSNADKVRIDNNIGLVNAAGSITVDSAITTTYTLSAEWVGGVATAQVVVEATSDHPPFLVTSMTMNGTECTMSWESQPAASYTIEASTNLVDWSPIAAPIASQGATTTATIDLAETPHAGAPRLFMRVRAE